MDDARRIWSEKSDEDLIEAAGELDQFTDEGKAIIRDELKRRNLEDPVAQQGDDNAAAEALPDPECLRCHVPLRLIEPDDGDADSRWAVVPGVARFDPGGSVYAYVCPRCGHVDLFMDPPEGDQPG